MASKEYQIAVKIAGQLDKSFNAALSGASSGLSALGAIGKVGGASLKIAEAALTATAAAVGAVGVASINTGREFEAAMDSVAATANATADEYAALEAAAMEMGRTTSKTATESAQALEYMSLAGWTVQESIEGLPSVLRLSEAAGMDLATTSDLVTDSMSALGLEVEGLHLGVEGLSGYLDVAARANNKSNQTAQQLMEAYLGVGGTLNGLNVPIAESATALGVLANRGIKGSEAGNALNAVLVNLTTGTGQAGKMMQSLGISAFDSEGKFIGLEATLQQVNTALSGLSDEERNAALAAIGGKTHVDALNALLAGMNTEVAEGVTEWADLQAALEGAGGALEKMAAVKLDNLNGDLATFQSALQDTGIKIYKNLQEPLRGAVKFGTQQIYKLSDALAEGGFEGLAQAAGGVLADVLTQTVNYAPQFVAVASSLAQALIRGLGDNGPALGSAAAQLLTTALIAFISFYGDFWSTGVMLLAQVLQGLVSQGPQIQQAGIQMVQTLSSSLQANAPLILAAGFLLIIQLINGLNSMLPTLTQMGLTLIQQFLQALVANAPALISGGITLLLNLAIGILQAIPIILAQVPALTSAIIDGLLSVDWIGLGIQIISALAEGIAAAIYALFGTIGSLLGGLVDLFKGGGENASAAMAEGLESGTPEVAAAASNAAATVTSSYQIDTGALRGFGFSANESLAAGITESTGTVAEAAYSAGTQTTAEMQSGLLAGSADITSAMSALGLDASTALNTSLTSNLPTIDAAALASGTAITDGITSGIDSGMAQATATAAEASLETINTMGESISAGAEAITQTVSEMGQSIADTFTDGMTTATEASETAMTAIQAAVDQGMSQSQIDVESTLAAIQAAFASTDLTSSGRQMMQGLINGLESMRSQVISTAQSIASDAAAAVNSALQVHSPSRLTTETGEFTGEGLVIGLDNMRGAVENAATALGNAAADGLSYSIGFEGIPTGDLGIGTMADVFQNEGTTAGVGGYLDYFDGGGYDDDGDPDGDPPPIQITYAPQYHFEGEAPTKEDIVGAEKMSQAEFNRMLDRYFRDKDRVRF